MPRVADRVRRSAPQDSHDARVVAPGSLAEHQRTGIEWIRREGRGLLGDEPGLGKSRTAIESFDGGRVLVVAPSMVIAGGTWREELEKWAKHPDDFEVVPYSMLNRRIKTGANKSASRPVDDVREEYDHGWDALIVDEAHYTKGRKTHWTKAVEHLAKKSDAVLEMTGTPMPNWAHELFTLCRVIWPDEAKRGSGEFGGYNRWLDKWFLRTPSEHGGPHSFDIQGLKACGWNRSCLERAATDPCEHYDQFVAANLGDRFLRRLRSVVQSDMPPLTESVVSTPMDTAQARMYRELKKDFLTNTDAGEEVIAWTPGARNVLLDRITTSGWFLDMEGEPRGGKLDRLRFDLEARGEQPTLVLAHYRDSVEACARVAESVGLRAGVVHGGVSLRDKSRRVADFKAGRLQVLVGSLETLAEGLTLTVADTAIFVEKSYKPSRNEQAMRRIHRMGQTRACTVIDYVTPGSVDSNKRELLATKTDQQMRVLSAAQFRALL